MNPKLRALFEEYEEVHRHPMNRLTHKIAIPLIVFHIVAMLSWIPLGTVGGLELHLGHLAYLAVVAWYLSLNVKLALVMAVLYALCFPLAEMVSWPAVVAIAIGAWAIQLAGHAVWEKRSPAFTRNLLQALVGPLYFVAILLGDWRFAAEAPRPERAA